MLRFGCASGRKVVSKCVYERMQRIASLALVTNEREFESGR